jgi:hypothetical protein
VLDLENTALGTSSELKSPFKLASIIESELRQAKLCFYLYTVASIEECVREPSTRWGSALTIFLEPCYSIIILSYLFKCLSYDASAGVPLLEDSAAMGCFIQPSFNLRFERSCLFSGGWEADCRCYRHSCLLTGLIALRCAWLSL